MYENDYMYAIERSPEYLAHYGIRGMKWGVQRARKSGNDARLGRQYAKAQKKLAKLEKQAGKSKKYARRAALMGAGAAAAGGLAAAGTSGVGNAVWRASRLGSGAGKAVGTGMNKVGRGLVKAGIAGHNKYVATLGSNLSRAGTGLREGTKNLGRVGAQANIDIAKWGNSNSIAKAAAGKYGKLAAGKGAAYNTVARDKAMSKIGGISNNTIARVGAGVVGAGLAAGAARNAYKAATAKKKAEKFRAAMNESFKGTKYANGGNSGNRQGKPRQGKKRRR